MRLKRGALVALGLDQHIQNLALGVDGAPQIDHAPIDFQIDLVKMPGLMRLGTALPQFRCNDRSEMIHPTPNGLVGNRYSASGQQVLDVTRAEGEPEVEPYRLVNDLRREPVFSAHKAEDMTAPTISATPKKALDQRATSRHDIALQACRRGARQQDGAHRLRNAAGQDGLSGNSGVRSVGTVRGRARQEPRRHRSRG
jgi:hypothetical protein